MSKLCLGTYLTVLTLCKSNPKTSGQRKILNAIIFSILGNEMEISAPEVSKIKKGSKDLEGTILDDLLKVLDNTDDFSPVQNCFEEQVFPLLHPDKISEAVSTLTRIIIEDNSLGDNYVIDPINNISKNMLLESRPDKSFLLGIFIYIVKSTNNVKCEEYVKEITEDYIHSSLNKHFEKAPKAPSSILSERDFCIKYEDDIALLPLCQIANLVNPTHNHGNEMYTEYCKFSPDIQSKIMQLYDYPLVQFKTNDLYSLLTKFINAIRIKGLSSDRYLYIFPKYFPNSLFYGLLPVDDFDPRIFPCEPTKHLPNRTTCTLSGFIDDYLYNISNGENKEKPFDWMWKNLSLSSCTDQQLIFWCNLFIYAACDHLASPESGSNVQYLTEPTPEALKTLEDFHFAVLLKLYQTFYQ